MWSAHHRLLCLHALLALSILLPLSFAHVDDHHHHQQLNMAAHDHHQELYMKWKGVISKRDLVAKTDYEGDYASIPNTVMAAPPPFKRRRSLLQDYGPVANQNSSPTTPTKRGL